MSGAKVMYKEALNEIRKSSSVEKPNIVVKPERNDQAAIDDYRRALNTVRRESENKSRSTEDWRQLESSK